MEIAGSFVIPSDSQDDLVFLHLLVVAYLQCQRHFIIFLPFFLCHANTSNNFCNAMS